MNATTTPSRPTTRTRSVATAALRIERLRTMAFEILRRMYRPSQQDFVFRLRRDADGVVGEGESARYTAITLMGLAREAPDAAAAVLHGDEPRAVCTRLVNRLGQITNIGDAALILRAAIALDVAPGDGAWAHLQRLVDGAAQLETVELAWVVSALCEGPGDGPNVALRERTAGLLSGVFNERTGLFPHTLTADGRRTSRHVACFADLVYPIQALAQLHVATGNTSALRMAAHCGRRICELMGPAGQWWWHYDVRSGAVLERYPVYSVHQHAMAPMALAALSDAGGPDLGDHVGRGLDWLFAAPELGGGTLIDADAGLVWRKVARREPRKLVRKAQAAAARVHSRLRVPAADWLFPPRAVDYECRPYEFGWLLYAWPPQRRERWQQWGGG